MKQIQLKQVTNKSIIQLWEGRAFLFDFDLKKDKCKMLRLYDEELLEIEHLSVSFFNKDGSLGVRLQGKFIKININVLRKISIKIEELSKEKQKLLRCLK